MISNNIMYNMWSRQLLIYLRIIQFPLLILTQKEIKKCFEDAINKTALDLMCLYNLTFYEAKMLCLKNFMSE